MITTKPLSRVEQIQKLRKLVGESMHVESILRNVMDLCEDLKEGRVPDTAMLGGVYSVAELKAVGAWWCVGDILFEITGTFCTNIIITTANKLKVDMAREKQEVMRLFKLYGVRQVDVANNAMEYLIQQWGEGDVNDEALAFLQERREAHYQSLNPTLLAEAKSLQTDLEIALLS